MKARLIVAILCFGALSQSSCNEWQIRGENGFVGWRDINKRSTVWALSRRYPMAL